MIDVETGRHTGRDTLDTATTCETTDGRLGDALDVVTKNLAVTLGTTLAEALATFAACEDMLAKCMKTMRVATRRCAKALRDGNEWGSASVGCGWSATPRPKWR